MPVINYSGKSFIEIFLTKDGELAVTKISLMISPNVLKYYNCLEKYVLLNINLTNYITNNIQYIRSEYI